MSLLLETENWKLRVGHLKPAEARESHQPSRRRLAYLSLSTESFLERLDLDHEGGCSFQLT